MVNKKETPPLEDESLDEGDESITEVEMGQVMLRPDGYHWQSPDGKHEFGPFESLEAALTDMESASEEPPEPGESLEEAEDEIGVADWIDPDTGELAEGQSAPRLHDE